jgi:GT2 family glycosyltransferase
MPSLSIVIVNYNVRYFLRQCLQSIYKSEVNADLELIVVDNASEDGSVDMLKKEFPGIRLICNSENLGFSKANNAAFKIAASDFILVLNPDTILQEDTLQCCLDFMNENPQAGAVGVRMFDGSGSYLPESKRGFPPVLGSLFKLSGLSKLFSSSSFFNAYYMGHLDAGQIQKVDVLSGAFMFLRKSVIDETGGFDEDYFMYGEDIELCFRIRESGKEIIYLPQTSIIHFKGESTDKNTIAYLKRFYGAMQIYSAKRKVYSGWQWKSLLSIGIFLAALSSVLKTLGLRLLWPLTNLVVLFLLARLIQYGWAVFYFKDASYYESAHSDVVLLSICASQTALYYFFGHFDKVYRHKQWIYASLISGLSILAAYGLFPDEWRFSRAVLVFLGIISPFVMYVLRMIYNRLFNGHFSMAGYSYKRVLIVGEKKSTDRVKEIVDYYYKNPSCQIFDTNVAGKMEGTIDQDIQAAAQSFKCNEIIFCSRDLDNTTIFKCISSPTLTGVSFRIADKDNAGLLGSQSKDTLGEWFAMDIGFKLGSSFHQRSKRLIDIVFVCVAVLFFPLILVLSNSKKKIYGNLVPVLLGNKSWIAYESAEAKKSDELPVLPEGVFKCSSFYIGQDSKTSNILYARHYNIWSEIENLLKAFFS